LGDYTVLTAGICIVVLLSTSYLVDYTLYN